MKLQTSLRAAKFSMLFPILTIAITIGIFIVDTITDLEIAVPVLYTVVVLMSVRFCSSRGVILVGVGCIVLTVLSDVLTTNSSQAGLVNTAISLLAIAATTYLAVKIETAEAATYEARAQLAHVARVTMLGELTASIAHEVNQPLAASVINGNACLRWLAAQPPNLQEARDAVEHIVADAHRASEVVARVRNLAKRRPLQKEQFDVNESMLEVIALTSSEIQNNHISLQTRLADGLPAILGDRVQLQQVVLNLILNAVEAMSGVAKASGLALTAASKVAPGFAQRSRHSEELKDV